MVYAAIRQGPLGATRLKGIDKKAGLASRDVLYVVEHDRWVAAVARNWWAANRALDRFAPVFERSEEHTSELQSLMRISYAVLCLKKKKQRKNSKATKE